MNSTVTDQKTPKAAPKTKVGKLILNALLFRQGNAKVYCFAMPGNRLTEIADLSRAKRDGKNELEGFQRPEIQLHVRQIAEYLDMGPNLFPNAVILALSPQVSFTKKRGTKIEEINVPGVDAGRLVIPVLADGEKVAWVVDGQQRSLALAKSNQGDLLVPVVAFESESIETHREQFILVNRARPLPQRLINELLPETDDTLLPRDLSANKVPSTLCELLNTKKTSPFYKKISRISGDGDRQNMIIDSAVVRMIRDRINGTSGALMHLKSAGKTPADLTAMLRLLIAYWSAVANVFPKAWALPPKESKLTAAVGVYVMGVMMDRICARIGYEHKNLQAVYEAELKKIAKNCAWTSGEWPDVGMSWDALETTSKSSSRIVQALGAAYVQANAS